MLLKTLNRTLEEYNIPKEEFWEDPYGFIDKLEDEDLIIVKQSDILAIIE